MSTLLKCIVALAVLMGNDIACYLFTCTDIEVVQVQANLLIVYAVFQSMKGIRPYLKEGGGK